MTDSSDVLVVLDGSATSLHALDVAATRARDAGGGLTLLAIIPPGLWRAEQGQFQMAPQDHDERFAAALLDEGSARCQAAGVACTTIVRAGSPAEVITAAADGFGLVVMGERRTLSGAPTLAAIVAGRLGDRVEVVSEEV